MVEKNRETCGTRERKREREIEGRRDGVRESRGCEEFGSVGCITGRPGSTPHTMPSEHFLTKSAIHDSVVSEKAVLAEVDRVERRWRQAAQAAAEELQALADASAYTRRSALTRSRRAALSKFEAVSP